MAAAANVDLSSGLVSRLQDLSGLERHAKQSGAARPTFVPSEQDLNNMPSLLYSGGQFLDTDAMDPVSQPLTATAVVLGDSSQPVWVYDNPTTDMLALYKATPTTYVEGGGTFFDTTWGITAPHTLDRWNELHVLKVVQNGASSSFYDNGILVGTGTIGTQKRVGYRLGARGGVGGTPFHGHIPLFYERAKAEGQGQALRESLALLKIYMPGYVIVEGDSRTADDNGHVPLGSAWPTVMRAQQLMGRPIRMRNQARSGDLLANMSARLTADVLNLYTYINTLRPFAKYVLVFGINDILPPNNRSAASVFADALAIAATVAATGVEVVLGVEPDYISDASHTVEKLALRNAVRTNGLYRVADFAADPRLSDATNPNYFADSQHENVAGQLAMAQVAGAQI